MNFYKLLDIETGEDLYVNPKHIVFYMRTADGVLIDNGSVRILTLEADFEKFGGISNETMQLKSGEFTAEIEKEIREAMQEIIERWQPFIDNIPTEELFAEKQKQIRKFSDYETTLTDLVEQSFNKI